MVLFYTGATMGNTVFDENDSSVNRIYTIAYIFIKNESSHD